MVIKFWLAVLTLILFGCGQAAPAAPACGSVSFQCDDGVVISCNSVDECKKDCAAHDRCAFL